MFGDWNDEQHTARAIRTYVVIILPWLTRNPLITHLNVIPYLFYCSLHQDTDFVNHFSIFPGTKMQSLKPSLSPLPFFTVWKTKSRCFWGCGLFLSFFFIHLHHSFCSDPFWSRPLKEFEDPFPIFSLSLNPHNHPCLTLHSSATIIFLKYRSVLGRLG